ncbi:hypothetical protein BW716_21725 [[Flexibacter] sp. ATCC 35208]|nr:hypothetical protein BW716_21725 [[Flexibacter] sp. ATCC 35208]
MSRLVIFLKEKLRTTEPNVILELISRPSEGSEEEKKRKVGEFSDLSISVPSSGKFFNQVWLIINKLYQLFILNIPHFL